jgi:hypothetical protein
VEVINRLLVGDCALTFSDKVSFLIKCASLFSPFIIDRLVCFEIIEFQMFRQFDQFVFTERFAEESGNLLDFSS